MKNDPICPNDELARVQGILEECALCPEHISKHTIMLAGLILGRLHSAQAKGLVLPDPDDQRTWRQVQEDFRTAQLARLAESWAALSRAQQQVK